MSWSRSPSLYGATHDFVIWPEEDAAALGTRSRRSMASSRLRCVRPRRRRRHRGGPDRPGRRQSQGLPVAPGGPGSCRASREGPSARPDEAVLGPGLAATIGARVGGEMSVLGIDGEVGFRVVGLAVGAGTDELDQGLTVTVEGLGRICQLADDPAVASPPHRASSSTSLRARRSSRSARASRPHRARRRRGDRGGPATVDRPQPRRHRRRAGRARGAPRARWGSPVWLTACSSPCAGVAVTSASPGRSASPRAGGRDAGLAGGGVALAGSLVGLLGGLIAGRLLWGMLARGIHAFVEVSVPVAVFALPVLAVAVALVVSIAPGLPRRAPASERRAEGRVMLSSPSRHRPTPPSSPGGAPCRP